MDETHSADEVWPRNRWQDHVKRFFGIPVEPPVNLSTFVADITVVEREVAKLSSDALNFQDHWRFEPMGRWSYKPLWFYIYQVQAYGQTRQRCRAVIDLLMQFGADMRDLYSQPELLGSFQPNNDGVAFGEIKAARERSAAQRNRDEKSLAVELIKAGGGELHPLDGPVLHWSSSPGGPRLDLAPGHPEELMICALLNDGLLEELPGKSNPQSRRESAYRLTTTANANFARAS